MGFNGISGFVNQPGEIPWEIVVLYFAIAIAIAFFFGKKTGGLKGFSTLDLVYIGIGAAFSVVWEFYIGAFLGKFIPSNPFISVGFLGRLVIVFIVVGLVRKVGTGILTLAIFDILGDLFHYGFGGEPVFLIYESLTYGLFLDLLVAFTGGQPFGISTFKRVMARGKPTITKSTPTVSNDGEEEEVSTYKPISYGLAAVEGAIIGALWAFPDPLFYDGFFKPFLYGGYVDWGKIIFNIEAFLPGDIIMGIIAGILAIIIARAVGQ
ncbi:hypothetical protein DFR86_10490 [Acidianus sulfidivorans JP7]|uniref:Uncharacterized protein n=1 Tax=Acidianus sulfidivorans JP7 TaxID=619593 RepID=A0A2U9IPI5_9CREN|nr:hypothetical protein [Acidianus sulfidivorans]AWR97922.1 hypothetical protein DFR86_10490 [Acidianus sulfidivorans JP7]